MTRITDKNILDDIIIFYKKIPVDAQTKIKKILFFIIISSLIEIFAIGSIYPFLKILSSPDIVALFKSI